MTPRNIPEESRPYVLPILAWLCLRSAYCSAKAARKFANFNPLCNLYEKKFLPYTEHTQLML
jgi:hypothetical protein